MAGKELAAAWCRHGDIINCPRSILCKRVYDMVALTLSTAASDMISVSAAVPWQELTSYNKLSVWWNNLSLCMISAWSPSHNMNLHTIPCLYFSSIEHTPNLVVEWPWIHFHPGMNNFLQYLTLWKSITHLINPSHACIEMVFTLCDVSLGWLQFRRTIDMHGSSNIVECAAGTPVLNIQIRVFFANRALNWLGTH